MIQWPQALLELARDGLMSLPVLALILLLPFECLILISFRFNVSGCQLDIATLVTLVDCEQPQEMPCVGMFIHHSRDMLLVWSHNQQHTSPKTEELHLSPEAIA